MLFVLQLSVAILFAELLSNNLIASPHRDCLLSAKISRPTCKTKSKKEFILGEYYVYRHYFRHTPYRRCRFQPTCSLFAIRSIEKDGFFVGFFNAITRAQISHSHHFNTLRINFFDDGKHIFYDPIDNWR